MYYKYYKYYKHYKYYTYYKYYVYYNNQAITDLFDLKVELNPDDFVGFGLKNSRVYFAKLAGLMAASNLSKEGKFMVFVMATAIKNKNRILEAMKAFEQKAWYGPVQQFFFAKTCQYTKS